MKIDIFPHILPVKYKEAFHKAIKLAISPRKTTSRNACGVAVSGFLVKIERADLDELRRQNHGAFARLVHPTAGPSLDSHVEVK